MVENLSKVSDIVHTRVDFLPSALILDSCSRSSQKSAFDSKA